MHAARPWFTPLTIGSFVLVAVTGVLLFFRLDSGLNKLAHECLSGLLLIGVAGHVWANGALLKRHVAMPHARWIVGVLLTTLALSFVRLGPNERREKPPFAGPIAALAAAPLPVLAQVAGVSPEQMQRRLALQGVVVVNNASTVAQSVGTELYRQAEVLNAVLTVPH
jgi:hypothetical protein